MLFEATLEALERGDAVAQCRDGRGCRGSGGVPAAGRGRSRLGIAHRGFRTAFLTLACLHGLLGAIAGIEQRRDEPRGAGQIELTAALVLLWCGGLQQHEP